MHLYTDEGDIDTTANHPFYVIGKGWVAAGDLVEGDEVYNLDGTTSTITGYEVEKLDEPLLVYNLEVEDFHSYFVGNKCFLVHNYYKSDHASQRQSEGRNVGRAINDLNKARPADVFIEQSNNRYVVKGSNGRVHIWESYRQLVTTVDKMTNFDYRVSIGRYRPLNLEELKQFAKIFSNDLNKQWTQFK